ncbi:hypothetical protein [Mycoplasmopsis fermentans]|nr:hypothetical protein [Mycoplasmopsis fermentans]VEU67253.1 Uncharacterised protein [Mesomycoplasma conjunctivae]ADN69244.1 hypothetical membrane spanning protein [Mycoplasmopsis fermentans JER]ADV34781.1 Hypothetical Protein MfeM64YM_0786 [Mycoplasmopsis fermentans M64]RMX34940.1 hypothetical protein MFI1_0663 [Mycoplasmopsis fermentans MF-I1]RMX35013.1 hypothetical protein MFI2_0642 [Mycoplasmopsis fermentans MF-I2]
MEEQLSIIDKIKKLSWIAFAANIATIGIGALASWLNLRNRDTTTNANTFVSTTQIVIYAAIIIIPLIFALVLKSFIFKATFNDERVITYYHMDCFYPRWRGSSIIAWGSVKWVIFVYFMKLVVNFILVCLIYLIGLFLFPLTYFKCKNYETDLKNNVKFNVDLYGEAK